MHYNLVLFMSMFPGNLIYLWITHIYFAKDIIIKSLLSAVLPPDVQVHVDGGLGLDGDVRAGLLYILVDVCVSTVDLVKE